MIWLFVGYALVGMVTMLVAISSTCSVDNESCKTDGDLLTFVLLGIVFGVFWPATLVYIFLFAFAKMYLREVKTNKRKKELN